jgi:hypothetical protein
MNGGWKKGIALTAIGVALLFSLSVAASADEPVNFALQANVTASSEFSSNYAAVRAIDGLVPQGQLDGEWAVKGTPDGEFTLQWDQPVEAAQVVFFTRVTSSLLECFKDYEVYLDDAETPVITGTFEQRRGPQFINFPKQAVSKIRLSFLNSHPDSPNPGASEIAVFAETVTANRLIEMSLPAEEKTPEARRLRETLLSGELGFKDMLLVKRKPLNISHVYVYHVEGYRPGGGLYIYTPELGDAPRCIFDAGENGMITTADLSYDGTEIVFAMRSGGHVASNPVSYIEDISRYAEEESNYQIFRINIDGTGLTQLTTGAYNNLDPCWLPDGGVAFISDRKPAYAYCYVVTSPVLYRMDRNGEEQLRLSANYLMDFTPSALDDGRIIYTRWEYVDRAACPIQSLWAINPDGTSLTGVYGNRVISPGTFMDARSIPGTNSIIATATNHNGSCRGGIVAIDPAVGANSPDALRNLTPDVDIYAHRMGGGPWGNGMLDCRIGGSYEKPFAVDADHYFVSKGGVLQLRDFDANTTSLLYLDEGMGWYSPQPIIDRPVPPILTGTVMDRDAVLPEDGSVTGAWATVFVQDVYNGLEPFVKRGDIAQIAVVQEIEKSTHSPQNNVTLDGHGMRNIAVFGFQFPLVSCGATYAPKRLWGFADVNEDGSATFKVPAEVPIYFMALDKEGRAIQRMRSFTHLMPGEVQGCVGCHSDRNSAAPRSGSQLAMSGEAQDLQMPEWGPVGFLYPEVVQPVWDRNCIECHNEREQPGGIDMSGDKTDFFNVSYDVLARKDTLGETNWIQHGSPSGPEHDDYRGMSPYVEWIWTINGAGHNVLEIEPGRWGSPASSLAELIRSGHPDEDGNPRINVPDADRRRAYLWMDLNVPYYGTSSSNHKTRLGSRRMYPPELDPTLAEITGRRCASCHEEGIPRAYYTRMLEPENNSFLLAPLAESAGGTQACGEAVFASKDDPDYQRLINVFGPIQQMLEERPRADMPGFIVLEECEDDDILLDASR